MNKYKKLTLDTFLFGISAFASKFLIFFLLPLYTSVLSTSEYGIADLLNNIVNLIYPVLTLALAESCLRFAFIKEVKKNEIISGCLFFVFISVLILLCGYPIVFLFKVNVSKYYLYFILLYLGYSLQNCFSFYCRGIDKRKTFAIQGVIQTFSLIILNICLLLIFKCGLRGFLLSTIISYFISVIYMIYDAEIYYDIRKFSLNWQLIKEMLKYSLPIIPTMVSWWISTSLDKYFIIAFMGIGVSGIYSVAHKIPSLIMTISSVFNNAWSISAISENETKNKEEFYSNVFNLYFVFMILGSAIITISSPFLCKILLAKSYYVGWVFVPPLICASFLQALAGFLASIFRAIKKTNILFVSTAIGALFNIIFNYILIQILGTIGVAYATLISFLIVFTIRLITCSKYVKLKLNLNNMFFSIISLIMICIIFSYEIKGMYIYSVMIMFVLIFINKGSIKKTVNFINKKIKSKNF